MLYRGHSRVGTLHIQRSQQGSPLILHTNHVSTHRNNLTPKDVTVDQCTASLSARYRPISELELAEAIWLVGEMMFRVYGCKEQTWIQGKKEDLAESSVWSLIYGIHYRSVQILYEKVLLILFGDFLNSIVPSLYQNLDYIIIIRKTYNINNFVFKHHIFRVIFSYWRKNMLGKRLIFFITFLLNVS